MREAGFDVPPVEVVNDRGVVVPELRAILRIIARHDLVLATGHLGRDELFAVVHAAREAGARHIIVTHPDFPFRALPIEDQIALAESGAFLEHCFTPLFSGKVPWETTFAHIRAVGVHRVVLSTVLASPDNPPVEDGLALFADRLLDAGVSEEEIRIVAVHNLVRLARGRDT